MLTTATHAQENRHSLYLTHADAGTKSTLLGVLCTPTKERILLQDLSAALVLAKLPRGRGRGGGACPRKAWRVFHGVCPAFFFFYLLFADSGMPDVAFLSAWPSGGEAFFLSGFPATVTF